MICKDCKKFHTDITYEDCLGYCKLSFLSTRMDCDCPFEKWIEKRDAANAKVEEEQK